MKSFLKSVLGLVFWVIGFFRVRSRPERPRSIFVVASGWLGDTFWALQTLREIRKRYPDAAVFAGIRTPFAKALLGEDGDYIEIDSVPSDRRREKFSLSRLVRDASFIRGTVKPDLVIDLVCNRYSALFSFLTHAYTVGCDIALEGAPLYSFIAHESDFPCVHLAYRPRSIVRRFFNWRDDSAIELLPPSVKSEPLCSGKKTAVLVPGAGWREKEWGAENFHRLAEYLEGLGFEVIVSGSKNEETLCRSVGGRILCGDLSSTLGAVKSCSLFVGNDSGVTHIAASFGVPCVCVFMTTDPAKCRPLGACVRILERPSGSDLEQAVSECL